MTTTATGGIVVYVEAQGDRLVPASLEALADGQALAEARHLPLAIVLLGYHLGAAIQHAAGYGAAVYVCDSPKLEAFAPDTYAVVLASFVTDQHPALLILAATHCGNDVAGELAAQIGAGLVVECYGLHFSDQGRLQAHQLVGTGQIEALVTWNSTVPAVATLRGGMRSPATPTSRRASPVISIDCPPLPAPRLILGKHLEADSRFPDLNEADVIVAGGRGTGGPEGFAGLEKLARLLGGAVGASLFAVDEGWRTREALLGQTGKRVAPRVLFSVGISGTVHHAVGIRLAQAIVAINTDRRAPIFKMAHLKVVADARVIVPALVAALEEMRARSRPHNAAGSQPSEAL